MRRVSRRRIEAALDTLGDVSATELLDAGERDEIGRVRFMLERILDKRPRR